MPSNIQTPRSQRFRANAVEGDHAGRHAIKSHKIANRDRHERNSEIYLYLMSVAQVILIWNTSDKFGFLFQLVALGLIVLAASLLMASRRSAIHFTPWEFLAFAMTLCSLGVYYSGRYRLLDLTGSSVEFSVLLSVATVSCGIIARNIDLRTYLVAMFWSFGLITLTQITSDFQAFVAGLASGGRFAPLGTHPNLVGITNGLGILLSLYVIITKEFRLAMIGLFFAIIQSAALVSTSSRGAALGVILPVILIIFLRYSHLDRRMRRLAIAALVVAVFVFILEHQAVLQYFSDVFELESKDRGFGSGATGRDYQIRHFPALAWSDFPRFLFGTGLRTGITKSADDYTDISFLKIALQSGFPISTLVLVVQILTVTRLFKLVKSSSGNPEFLFILASAIYIFVSCTFAPYLFSIGNPTCFPFFILYIYGWLLTRKGRYPFAESIAPRLPRNQPVTVGSPLSGRDYWQARRHRRVARVGSS